MDQRVGEANLIALVEEETELGAIECDPLPAELLHRIHIIRLGLLFSKVSTCKRGIGQIPMEVGPFYLIVRIGENDLFNESLYFVELCL